VAYFKVLVNPRDEVNLLRILNFPKRGIGETTADRLIRASAEMERPLWEILRDPSGIEDLGEKGQGAIAEFVALMEDFRKRFARSGDLAALGREFLETLKIDDELYRTADDPKKARRRVENVAEVINALASYQEREDEPTLAGFLSKVSLLDRDEPSRGSKENKLAQDAVILMSLHSSKGLEFPQVFLVGMEEEYLPHKKSVGEHVDVDEERRLCYVGITRAREVLTLLGAVRRKKYGKMLPREPSRFLAEIPSELLCARNSESRPEASPEEEEAMASNFFSNMKALLGE